MIPISKIPATIFKLIELVLVSLRGTIKKYLHLCNEMVGSPFVPDTLFGCSSPIASKITWSVISMSDSRVGFQLFFLVLKFCLDLPSSAFEE